MARFDPFSYQTTMVEWLLDHPESALWASPGLGKTVVTLTAISRLILEGAARGALVIAPIRVCAITWPKQVRHWDHLRWMKIVNLRTPEGRQAWEDHSADIYLINSEQLPTLEKTYQCKACEMKGCELCEKGFRIATHLGMVDKLLKGNKNLPVDILVVDELTLAKETGSKRFKAVFPYLHDLGDQYKTQFSRKWGLTGTPAPNSYLDLFGQVKLLENGKRLGKNYFAFRKKYFQSDYMGWHWVLKDGAKQEIDDKLADFALVMLGDDWLDLPTCNTEDIEINLPLGTMTAYKALEKELLVTLDDGGEIEALSAATLVTKLQQLTTGCIYDTNKFVHVDHDEKLNALKKLRKKHKDEPLLVLTHYVHEMERLLYYFPEAEQFDEKDMDKWQAGKIPIWVANPKSMCHGIDGMQMGGRIAVWMTLPYSWETYTQTNARLVRLGQSNETIVYRILAKGTIDEAVAETLRFKEEGNSGLLEAVKNLQLLRANA